MNEYLKELYKDCAFLTGSQMAEAKNSGTVKKWCKDGWYVGKTVDLYGSSHDIGLTGTVTEIYTDGDCLIEIW